MTSHQTLAGILRVVGEQMARRKDCGEPHNSTLSPRFGRTASHRGFVDRVSGVRGPLIDSAFSQRRQFLVRRLLLVEVFFCSRAAACLWPIALSPRDDCAVCTDFVVLGALSSRLSSRHPS